MEQENLVFSHAANVKVIIVSDTQELVLDLLHCFNYYKWKYLLVCEVIQSQTLLSVRFVQLCWQQWRGSGINEDTEG